MRTAGVREARQDLSSLLDDVRRGREVVITDRGTPVARLVSIQRRPVFPDLAHIRRSVRINPRLAKAVIEDRDERT